MRRGSPFSIVRSARALTVLAVCFGATPVAVPTAQTFTPGRGETVPLVLPNRRASDTPPPAPPALPAGAERVTPVTLEAVIRRVSAGRSHAVRQTITRTVDRVRLAGGDRREWLFERNPVDPRRVAGLLVDHPARTIVIHEEGDLRLGVGIQGWADVLALGFDPGSLPRLKRTGRTRAIGGIVFAHFAGGAERSPSDVWWNEDESFPGGFTISDASGVTTFSIVSVARAVDQATLESPSLRFPDYKVIDFAGWLEHR